MNTRLVLSLCLLTVISACAPAATPPLPPREETRVMETATPTLVPNRPLTLAAPGLPLQVDGLDVPQEEGAVLLLAAEAPNLPEGSRRARTDVVRAEMHLVPVAVAEGMVLSAESKGQIACAVLPSISRPNPDNPDELQTLALNDAASAEGDYWVYTYNGVSQYVPKRVTKPGGSLGVYLAVDHRLGADGKAYFVAVDADGHLQQVMDAVSDEPQAGKWRAVAPGEFGLQGHEALLNAAGLTGNVENIKTEYDPNLHGEKVTLYAFTDEAGAVHEYLAEQIEWLALSENTQVDEAGQAWGLVVLRNAEGQIEYAWTENKWVKVEPVKSPNGTGAVTMSAAGWQFIEVNKRLLVLDPSQNEINAQGQEIVVSEEGERYVWVENGWKKESPFSAEQLTILESAGIISETDRIRIPAVDGYIDLPIEEADKVVITDEQITARGVKIFEKIDGQWAATEVLQYTLAATKEEAINHRLPWEFVSVGGPGKIAKLRAAPFPPEVMTGMDVVLMDSSTGGSKLLRWNDEARQYYENNPIALPVRIGGYFTFEYVDKEFNSPTRIWVGEAWVWAVGENETRGVTMMFGTDDFAQIINQYEYWPIGFRTKKVARPPIAGIAKNSIINDLLQQWVDSDEPPAQIEDHLVAGSIL